MGSAVPSENGDRGEGRAQSSAHVSAEGDLEFRGLLAGHKIKIGKYSVGLQGANLVNSKVKINSGDRSFALPSLAAVGIAGVLLVAVPMTAVNVAGSGIATDVVFQEGVAGARRTLEELKKAEMDADAESWCTLAQPGDGGCTAKMTAAFERSSQSYRDEIDKCEIGSVSIKSDIATAVMSYDGSRKGTVHLVWSRNRWAISPGEYTIIVMFGGGLYLSIVDSEHGQGLDDIFGGLGG